MKPFSRACETEALTRRASNFRTSGYKVYHGEFRKSTEFRLFSGQTHQYAATIQWVSEKYRLVTANARVLRPYFNLSLPIKRLDTLYIHHHQHMKELFR